VRLNRAAERILRLSSSMSIIIIILIFFTSNNTPTNKGLGSSLTTFYLKHYKVL
jgi:hypothetical protein